MSSSIICFTAAFSSKTPLIVSNYISFNSGNSSGFARYFPFYFYNINEQPLKKGYINVIPKQDSGFDLSDKAFSLGSYESQILNLVEESLFT